MNLPRVDLKKLSSLERLFWKTSISLSCMNPPPILLNEKWDKRDFSISLGNQGPYMTVDTKTKKVKAYTFEEMRNNDGTTLRQYFFALDKLSKNGYEINFVDSLGPWDMEIVT
jgi:hypothetical protein